jgi:ribosome-binding protein aMBF1 (putative translation factor)
MREYQEHADGSEAQTRTTRRRILLGLVFCPLAGLVSPVRRHSRRCPTPAATAAPSNRPASAEILRCLAANTRRLREARGYSRNKLAERCGFAKGYIRDIEWALVDITLHNLEVLADSLRCTMADLVRRPTTHTFV